MRELLDELPAKSNTGYLFDSGYLAGQIQGRKIRFELWNPTEDSLSEFRLGIDCDAPASFEIQRLTQLKFLQHILPKELVEELAKKAESLQQAVGRRFDLKTGDTSLDRKFSFTCSHDDASRIDVERLAFTLRQPPVRQAIEILFETYGFSRIAVNQPTNSTGEVLRFIEAVYSPYERHHVDATRIRAVLPQLLKLVDAFRAGWEQFSSNSH